MKWSLYLTLWSLSFCPAFAEVDLNEAIAATSQEIQKIQQTHVVSGTPVCSRGERMKIEDEGTENISSPSSDNLLGATNHSERYPSSEMTEKMQRDSLNKEIDAAQ